MLKRAFGDSPFIYFMPKNVKAKTKKAVKKTVVKKPKKAAVRKKAAQAKAKPRKTKTAAKPERERTARGDIEKKIDEIDIESIIRKERDKRMILWAGVSFFMVLIFGFWIYNLKHTFKKIENENAGGNDFEWSEITGDFSKTMDEMKENLAEIKKFADTAENYEAATSTVAVGTSTISIIGTTTEEKIISTSTPVKQDDLDEIEELKARLEELEKKLNASTE
jgi:type II secretory pathway component PulM